MILTYPVFHWYIWDSVTKVTVLCFQKQVQELRGQIEQELKSHQATKDQMGAKDKQLQETKQQV